MQIETVMLLLDIDHGINLSTDQSTSGWYRLCDIIVSC